MCDEIKYKCPECRNVFTLDELDALGFKTAGCPDCGVDIDDMEEVDVGE